MSLSVSNRMSRVMPSATSAVLGRMSALSMPRLASIASTTGWQACGGVAALAVAPNPRATVTMSIDRR